MGRNKKAARPKLPKGFDIYDYQGDKSCTLFTYISNSTIPFYRNDLSPEYTYYTLLAMTGLTFKGISFDSDTILLLDEYSVPMRYKINTYGKDWILRYDN